MVELALGHAQWAATGAVVTRPLYAVLHTEGLLLVGRPAKARELQMPGPALRATLALAPLWAAAGRQVHAAALLDGCLGAVTEGTTTHDVVQARALRLGLAAQAAPDRPRARSASGLHPGPVAVIRGWAPCPGRANSGS